MKREIHAIDGTPKKRVFLSIISDYDLRSGLCELIDNALDLWVKNKKKKHLKIEIALDTERQMISVRDNAGGVAESDLALLITPGATQNDPSSSVIGIFGVGGKRASIALGEHIEIRTRKLKGKSLELDITKDWVRNEDWELPAYEVSDLPTGVTTVDISQLRQPFDEFDVLQIHAHLSATYAWFIDEGCTIELNRQKVEKQLYDSWAYPPNYLPKQVDFRISPDGNKNLDVKIYAGLIRDRVPETENYGVYIYCNHRLIVKELRTRDVGYHVTTEAGVPHPDASLCRVIVHINGPAGLMPWNSSKNGINYSHPAFQMIRPTVISLVSYFSKLSRRFKKNWDDQVFAYSSGSMEDVEPVDPNSNKKIVLPDLPRAQKRKRVEEVKVRNRKIIADKPWTLGLVESMGLVDLIEKQRLDTKNRAALILLDSSFEIALKEFIVNNPLLFPIREYPDSRILALFRSRPEVISEVTRHIDIPQTLLGKANHYYGLRNKLIHERATVGITDNQIRDYKKVIERVLKLLFGLKFPTD